jgi:hypothetical protein
MTETVALPRTMRSRAEPTEPACTLLRVLTAGIGTERKSARPRLACLESEVERTRIEAVSAG